MTVVLTITTGRQAGDTCEVGWGDFVTIGRSEASRLQVVEDGVSRKHCIIENKGNRVVLRDEGSSNGTFVNGERTDATLLDTGDEIQMGRAIIKVRLKGRGSGNIRRQSSLKLVSDDIDEAKVDGRTKQFKHRLVRFDQAALLDSTGDLAKEDDSDIPQVYTGLRSLYRVSSSINMANDLGSLYETVVDAALEISGGERAALLIRDQTTGKISPALVHCVAEKSGSNIKVSRSVVDHVLHSGDSAVSNNAMADSRFRTDSIPDQRIIAVMCVPVSGRDSIIGTLYVDTTQITRSFSDVDLEILTAIGFQAGVAIERARLISELETLFIGANRALVAAVEARDPYTHGHSERVTSIALGVADLLGMTEMECEIVELAGLLHDVGKIGVPESVLTKPGKLTDAEYDKIQEHPALGADIIHNIHHPFIKEVVDAVRHHHERIDGTGYPDGLAGDKICRTARLLAVADTFDAMTSDRPYRKGMDHDKAMSILAEVSGSQLDIEIVETFLNCYHDGDFGDRVTNRTVWKSKYVRTGRMRAIVSDKS